MRQNRITFNEKIISGKPIVKGTRLSVDFVLDLLVYDWSAEHIIENYPQLTSQDIQACLEYASNIIKEENVILMKK